MSGDPFMPIGTGGSSTARTERKPAWVPVLPVPDDAPPAPAEHFKLGKPAATWRYTDMAGGLLGYVYRFNTAGGDKVFRPLIYAQPAGGGKAAWRWESWPPKRPLYGLTGLAKRPNAPVVCTEGEKACDAAAQLLASYVPVTSPNGAKSAGKADWSPLRGRAVTIWPDADSAGLDYAHVVAKHARAAGAVSVAILSPPEGCKVGWDAADALLEGWNGERAGKLVAAAEPFKWKPATAKRGGEDGTTAGDHPGGGGRRRVPQRDVLIGLTEFVELWHDANRIAYATFPVNDHRENWSVRSRDFRMWLAGQFYEKAGTAIGGQALEDGIRILEARAVNEGPQHEIFTRTGHAGGNMYLDLGDATWSAVEITATGSRVIEKPSLKFLRSPSTRPLPAPEFGSLIEQLRQFINIKTDTDFMLVVAWLVGALRHRGPFPILVVNGEAGAGKSLFTRIVRSLVDPSAAPIRAMPRDDRDLVVSASNSWVLAFDNISKMEAWQADALCRLSTGSGFATRMLHTDRDEMIFEAARPIVVNGIPTLTDRADMADRAVTINLRALPDHERRPEDEILADFERAMPQIFGALLDAVSAAQRNLAMVKLDRVPRMADFAKWITAAEPGLGWEPGAFIAAYTENRRDVSEAAFDADNVAVAIWKLITANKDTDGFEGTPTELWEAVNCLVSEHTRKSKYWPQTVAALGNRVARAAPLLKAKGCTVERRHSGARIITIKPPHDVFA
jgi:hypothetical protein